MRSEIGGRVVDGVIVFGVFWNYSIYLYILIILKLLLNHFQCKYKKKWYHIVLLFERNEINLLVMECLSIRYDKSIGFYLLIWKIYGT